MRALSIKQPWSHAILRHGKDVENRSWSTNYRGPMLIHASKKPDADAVARLTAEGYEIPNDLQTGGIVGVVDVIDCVQNHPSRWAVDGEWHWVLANARPLPFKPCNGRLGLFDPEPKRPPLPLLTLF
jgi:ASCH domain